MYIFTVGRLPSCHDDGDGGCLQEGVAPLFEAAVAIVEVLPLDVRRVFEPRLEEFFILL